MELKFSEQFWATKSSTNQPNQIIWYDKQQITMSQLSLHLITHHTMKAYTAVEVWLLALFTLALNKGEL
jgi:hypothetical protein